MSSIFDNLNLNNVPSVEKTPISYRTTTSSEEYNKNRENVLSDLLMLFNKANVLEKSLNEASDIIDYENKYLQLKVQDLESKMATLALRYEDSILKKDIKTTDIYPEDVSVDSSISGAKIDLIYSDITSKESISTSKVNFYDELTGQIYVPPNLIATASSLELKRTPGVIDVNDNEITNAFNGHSSSYWVRKVTTDETIDEVTTDLIITLPESIMTTRDVNEISICPYPVNSVDITDLSYSLANSWVTFPDFLNHRASRLEEYTDTFGITSSITAITDANNLKFNFIELSANQIKISLRQRRYVNGEGGTRIFCLGAKEIDIKNNRYASEYCSFNFNHDFGANYMNTYIYGTEAVFNNPTGIEEDLIKYDYYSVDDLGVMHKIIDSVPFVLTAKKLHIKCRLYRGNVTPNISKLKLKYKIV